MNLATFVTTWMEPTARVLMAECMDKNMIDKDDPQTAELERRCVAMAGIALKRRWAQRRRDARDADDRPNLVMGANVQVCWEKFCRYWDVEPRLVGSSRRSSTRPRVGLPDPPRGVDQRVRLAVVQIDKIRRRGPRSVTQPEIDVRKTILDRFRRQNGSLRAHLRVTRAEQLSRAGTVAVALVLVLSLLFAAAGHVMVQRAARARRARQDAVARERAEQAEFAEAMLVARDEDEANALVKRHLERVIADSDVVMLSLGPAGEGLRAMTALRADAPLQLKLVDAAAEDCVAIRLGRPHEDGHAGDRLLRCELCGAQGSETFCVPSVVGNEVIGSVLVQRAQPLDDAERARVRESTAHSAPVLTNLRTLSRAELRATTDQLTGLPNRRGAEDELRRMVAQAGRTTSSLAAVVVDIDHFKQINDSYGHHVGDAVLSAVGAAIAATVRASDFAGRYGGEEFVLLLPDTPLAGATITAEKVRREIMRLDFPDVDETVAITASFGVAVLPDHASQGDSLLREADRALYAAKANGRNRVETAAMDRPRDDEPSIRDRAG